MKEITPRQHTLLFHKFHPVFCASFSRNNQKTTSAWKTTQYCREGTPVNIKIKAHDASQLRFSRGTTATVVTKTKNTEQPVKSCFPVSLDNLVYQNAWK